MVKQRERISVVVTSDVHGYVYPTDYSDRTERNIGLAKVSTLVNQIRQQKTVILVNSGDYIQGSPFTYYHAKFHSDTSNPMIKVANYMDYDASILGNHEFNYGQDYLKQVIKQSDVPWLSASVIAKSEGNPAFGSPYIIKKVNDIRIAILGVTTHYIPNWEEPKNIDGLAFEDAFEVTKKWVNHIQSQENPDVLIVCYHGGIERDIHTGEPTEQLTGENQGYQMCKEIDGIDILITGHQHRVIADEIEGKVVIQPGYNGQSIGQVEMELERMDNKWQLKDCSPSILHVDDQVKPDPEVLKLVEADEQMTQNWLDQPIGEVDGDMTITDAFEVRKNEHPFIEFINKVQMDKAGVDISSTALFSNESSGFPAHITMRDIVSNYIYPNTLKVIRVTGRDIKDALEQCATYFTINDQGNISVNPAFIEPKALHYNYDMWEGIEYELNIAKLEGARVTILNYQGKPIDMTREYEVVMNNYRAGGGGNYDMFRGKPVVKDIPVDMTEIIADYIMKRKKLKATCNHNWRVVKR